MVKALSSSLLVLWLLLAAHAGAQDVEVSVDRSEVARGETLTLTIRVFRQQQNIQLDLSSITENFDILSTRTSSQIRSINNRVESWVDYIITLFPTSEGELEIPPIDVGGQLTAPIVVSVVNAGPNSNQANNDLFLETEVNKESVYVQEQLLFTIRLYYTISGIRNPQFTELEMPDTVIQLIGSPNQYEKLVDGVRYGVYEKRYVIFPQRSGSLEIPDILFRGEVTDGSSNFVFRNLNTQRVTAYIEGSSIEVKERPEAARDLEFWLPATSLSVEESWDQDISNLTVGETINRTIRLVAEGLDGAVLPPFSPGDLAGANLYADPSDIQRTFVEGRIVGTRVETTQIVPTLAGTVVVPEFSIPWWDVEADQLRIASIPETRLTIASIAGDVPAEQTILDSGTELNPESSAPPIDQSMLDAQNEARLLNIPVIWLNAFIAAALLLVLASIYTLVIRGFKLDPVGALRGYLQQLAATRLAVNNEGVAFRALRKALRQGNPALIRTALLVWAAHFHAPRAVRSMDDILRLSGDDPLAMLCQRVQAALFNTAPEARIDAGDMESILLQLRNAKRTATRRLRRSQAYQLPPLYRT